MGTALATLAANAAEETGLPIIEHRARHMKLSYNPWGKRNPLMSMWLSGANALLGKTRSQVTASARRQTKAAIDEGTRQALAFWGLGTQPAKRKRRSR